MQRPITGTVAGPPQASSSVSARDVDPFLTGRIGGTSFVTAFFALSDDQEQSLVTLAVVIRMSWRTWPLVAKLYRRIGTASVTRAGPASRSRSAGKGNRRAAVAVASCGQ